MDQYYYQQSQQGRQGQKQGQSAQQNNQQWYQGQQQGDASHGQQYQHYDAAAYQAYYDQYQHYYAQQQAPVDSAAFTALASALPPSYSTPLPPAKVTKPNAPSSTTIRSKDDPLAQIQAQYRSSTQLGAAAASSVTAALFKSSSTTASSVSGTTDSTPHLYTPVNTPSAIASTNDKKRKNESSSSSTMMDTDWYSSYKAPSAQERKAALSATPSIRTPLPPKPQVTMNNNPRNNRNQNQRGGKQQGSHNNRQDHKQSKQNIQTTDTASTTEQDDSADSGFHCDACDVTFHEEAKLKVHIVAHRSCPDCAYKASPSLVSEHRKLTHGANSKDNESETATAGGGTTKSSSLSEAQATGSSRPVSSSSLSSARPAAASKPSIKPELLHPLTPTLNTPEDIAAWIALRRKQWPTESNIQKKEQERQEMIAKGQIVDTPAKGKFDNKNKNKNQKQMTWKQRQEEARAQKKAKLEENAAGTTSESTTSTSTDVIMTEPSTSATEPKESNGEGNEGDEDEDMDPVQDAITSKDPSAMGKVLLPTERAQRPKRACRYFLKGTCHKGDKCTWSHDVALAAKVQKSVQASVKTEVFRTRPSLLQMLLSGEIKQEKNVLLEAMRYIVDSNFFERQEPTGSLVQEIDEGTTVDTSVM
ncbi:hypothetical protein BGZ83_008709 [Gryganskiella cystojenkinii]|nr:hypothetical protein BGZ83_008709 [Gryganskiella cystojenkinii]